MVCNRARNAQCWFKEEHHYRNGVLTGHSVHHKKFRQRMYGFPSCPSTRSSGFVPRGGQPAVSTDYRVRTTGHRPASELASDSTGEAQQRNRLEVNTGIIQLFVLTSQLGDSNGTVRPSHHRGLCHHGGWPTAHHDGLTSAHLVLYNNGGRRVGRTTTSLLGAARQIESVLR